MNEDSRFSQEFGTLLNRIERQYQNFMNARMKPWGVSARAAIFLAYISRHPGTSQDAIANHCGIDKCTVARGAKRLENSGYIVRQTNAADRRQNNLFLTDAGQRALSIVRQTQREWSSRLSVVLTEQEQDQVIALFDRIAEQAAVETQRDRSAISRPLPDA